MSLSPVKARRRALILRDAKNFDCALRGHCRFCAKKVEPPRRTLCSGSGFFWRHDHPSWGCANELLIRTSSSYLRRVLRTRDKGVCALCSEQCGWREWDADHTIPLVEGGGGSLDNIRTLCRPCHKRETTALNARLAEKRAASVSACPPSRPPSPSP